MEFTMNMLMMRKHVRVHQQISTSWKGTRLKYPPVSFRELRDLVDILHTSLYLKRGMKEDSPQIVQSHIPIHHAP